MKEYQIKPEDLIYIGDETRDIEATHATAIRMAAVTWGYNSADILRSMNPEFLFDSPNQLLTFTLRTEESIHKGIKENKSFFL